MNKLLYFFLSFTLFVSVIHAQDCNDVTVSAVATPSNCQSSGTITINFAGSSAEKLVNKQYSLKSTTGSLAIGPVSSNAFSDLPPGTYNIEAAGFCTSISGESIVRTINNIVVAGNYEEPRLTFVAPAISSSPSSLSSRNSYKDYSTGLIVVLLEKGNQTEIPTFTITSAPVGVTVPQTVSATKSTAASAGGGWRYMLDKTWPAGTYTVSANDGCYTSTTSFNITEIAAVPPGNTNQNFYTYGDGTDCSKVYYQPYYYYNQTAYPDYYRYYSDRLYEYAIAPVGEMPADDKWHTVRYFSGSSVSYRDLIDLSPYKVSDFYELNSLTIYTRVKGCPDAIASFNYYNKNSFSFNSPINTCTGDRTYTIAKTSYPHNFTFCYPLTITITDQSDGAKLYEVSDYLYTDDYFKWVCHPGDKHFVSITDASGYKIYTNYPISGSVPTTTKPQITLNAIPTNPAYQSCDSYKRHYNSTAGVPCGDESAFPCYLTVTDNLGTIVKLDTLQTSGIRTLDGFEYDKNYTWTFVYPNWDNYTVTTISNLKRSSYIPDSFTLSKYTSSRCGDNIGSLRVSTTGSSKCFKAGTVIKITGPEGYVGQTVTYAQNQSNNSNGYYINFADTYLPPGEYTATVLSCGETYRMSANITNGYKADDMSYTTVFDCMGTQLYPSGGISSNGTPLSTVYFRMTQSPPGSGVASKVISSKSGDYFSLTTSGTYVLGMMVASNITECAIKLDTIVYNPPPLALDKEKTSAYACPSGTTGHLTLMATNGVAPYTYIVYDATNTTQLTQPMSSDKEIDLGDFGKANEVYTVRITDGCGNSFNQQVTLVALDKTALAYGDNGVCYNSPINIFGFTVTDASYSWTGPNGFTSTKKNPVIPNATEVNEGWYTVDIISNACGVKVTDSIHVSVYEPISILDLDGKTQEVTLCPYQALIINQPVTGGSGNYTYQWAYNTNSLGTGTWTNLTGETTPTFKGTNTTYMFSTTLAGPTRRHLRLTVTDEACGPYYLYFHTNVRACMFPVNPDLKSPVVPQKEI